MAKHSDLLYCAPITVLLTVLLAVLLPPLISAHNKISPPPLSFNIEDPSLKVPSSFNNEDPSLKVCDATPYIDICYTYLQGYKAEAKQNPALSRIMYFVNNTIQAEMDIVKNIVMASSQVGSVAKGSTESNEAHDLSNVLLDCWANFTAAFIIKKEAVTKMGQLDNPSSSSECKTEMSNIQTLLNDALKEENKCIENLGALNSLSGDVKKTKEAMEFYTDRIRRTTYNAITLVKDFVTHH